MSKHHKTDGAKAPPDVLPEIPIMEQDILPRDIGKYGRWQALDVISAFPGLSTTAKLLGHNLVMAMNAKTRACFPSHETLVLRTGLSIATVKRCKEELRQARLIDWHHPKGRRHLCHYHLNWALIIPRHHALKARERAEAERRRTEREARDAAPVFHDDGMDDGMDEAIDEAMDDDAPWLTHEPTNQADAMTSGDAANGSSMKFNGSSVDSNGSSVKFNGSQVSHNLSLGIEKQEVTHLSTTFRRAASHLEGAPIESTSERCGEEGEADPLYHDREVIRKAQPPPPPPSPPHLGQPSEGEMRLGAHAAPSPVILPTLRETWEDDAEAIALLARMSPDTQLSISGHLANKGKTAARQYLDEKAQAEAMMARFPALAAAFWNDARLLKLMQRACFDVLDDASKALARKGPNAAAAVLDDREGRERR